MLRFKVKLALGFLLLAGLGGFGLEELLFGGGLYLDPQTKALLPESVASSVAFQGRPVVIVLVKDLKGSDEVAREVIRAQIESLESVERAMAFDDGRGFEVRFDPTLTNSNDLADEIDRIVGNARKTYAYAKN
ncbi:hypothetical protein HYW60_00305 [Candidatus Kaiserbacteria bacterium]|nr:hypothetical protein [Candidatus Kaiserbacteria bacterium]